MIKKSKYMADDPHAGSKSTGADPREFPKANDTTNRNQVEVALSGSKKFLQTIIETEPECVKLVSADGTLLMMNRAGLEMIQVDSLDQAKGKSIYPLVVPENREAFMKLTEEVFQGKSGSLTFKMTGIKGRRLWLETHAVPLRNDKDEIIALLGITRDVTEQRKAEEDLKKERDFVSTVLNTVGSMIVVLDRDGRIVRFNRKCELVSGYTFEEVRGRSIWDFLIPPEQVDGVKKDFMNTLTSGTVPEHVRKLLGVEGRKEKADRLVERRAA